MKLSKIVLGFYLIFSIDRCFAQNFVNGDLDGVIDSIGSLPYDWQNVPFDDSICLATSLGRDSPDLLSLTLPNQSVGMSGNPFSGATFMAGMLAKVSVNSFGHEGIMQSVNELNIGTEYAINFRQTTLKIVGCSDKSGSWAVYIDSILAGISAPTHSNEPPNSSNLPWDARQINFIATDATHLIKFLPWDDDTNITYSLSMDTTAAIYMGIDSISLSIVTGMVEKKKETGIILYPNPASDVLSIEMQNNYTGTLKITDTFGKEMFLSNTEKNISHFSVDLSKFPSGFYFVTFSNAYGVFSNKFFKQ